MNIAFSNDRFELTDNCGGFDKKTAGDYAFRFGRPDERPSADHSIGQFGIGMKRAQFLRLAIDLVFGPRRPKKRGQFGRRPCSAMEESEQLHVPVAAISTGCQGVDELTGDGDRSGRTPP